MFEVFSNLSNECTMVCFAYRVSGAHCTYSGWSYTSSTNIQTLLLLVMYNIMMHLFVSQTL